MRMYELVHRKRNKWKRRSAQAHALAAPLYRKRIVPNKKRERMLREITITSMEG